MSVPIFDLTRQYAAIREEIESVVLPVLASGMYINGPAVAEFEKNFAAYCGVKHAIGVASGTDALVIAMRACGIEPGDEVIVPSFTFFATAEAVENIGAHSVFADVEYDDMCISPAHIEKLITKKTRAIMPVHLFGHAANMDAIREISKKHNLIIIEDACQAVGTFYNGEKAGAMSDAGCFSFFPTKNLGAAGDCGIITTNSDLTADLSRKLRNHGSAVRYYNDMLGYNSRLDTIQAAILNVKLKYLDEFNLDRRANHSMYVELLSENPYIELPSEREGVYHTFHQYTLKVKNGKRNELTEFLKGRGIGNMIYYPIPVHKLGPYDGKTDSALLPITMRLADEVISLPIFPELREEEIEEICTAVNDFFKM